MNNDPTMPPEEDTEDGVIAQSVGSIRHKFKQAAFRHLKVRLANELSERPSNCVHHSVRYMPSGAPVGLCRCSEMSDDDWPGVCDDRLTPEQPEKCGHFDTSRTKDEIKDDFREFLATAQLYAIASKYPDLAPFLWVLGEDAPGREVEVGDWEPNDEVRVEIYGHILTAEDAATAKRAILAVSDVERESRGRQERVGELERDLAETEAAHKEALKRCDILDEEITRYKIAMTEARDERDEAVMSLAESASANPDPPVPTGFRGWLWRWLTRTDS